MMQICIRINAMSVTQLLVLPLLLPLINEKTRMDAELQSLRYYIWQLQNSIPIEV